MRTPALRDVCRSIVESPMRTVSVGAAAACVHEKPHAVGLGLARPWSVAANHPLKIFRQSERIENPDGLLQRLVGEQRHRNRARLQLVEQAGNAVVGTRVMREPRVVCSKKTRRAHLRAGASTPAAVITRFTSVGAPHPTMLAMRSSSSGRRAVAGEHLVGAVGQIAPRIDECAVEIEHGQTDPWHVRSSRILIARRRTWQTTSAFPTR